MRILLRVLIVLLAIGGVVDSVRALRVHNQDPSAAPPCAVEGKWDCGAVNHSRYAVFPAESFDEQPGTKHIHIPVATAGIAGYSIIALLALWAPMWLVLQLAEIGCACAAILSYLEAFVIEKWCIYCVWSQGIIATIVVLCILTLLIEHRRKRFTHSAVMASR
jgi:vitamin-K-epoxide reductase (warfarin-sensitive)